PAPAGAGPRRPRLRRDRALRGRGRGHRPHRAAGRGAGAARRHRGESCRAGPRRGAPALPGGGATLRGGPPPDPRPARGDQGDVMTRLGRALISVHDKTGVVEFARGLVALGAEIVSTGGTAKLLRESGIAVVDVAEVTGFPEMLDGRVKTLHPKVHGGLLARRDLPEHVAALERHGIRPIDLVAVTLYPFEQTVARPGVSLAEAIENIDIGGPSMIRGAAKNHAHVAVVTDPAQYGPVLDELRT